MREATRKKLKSGEKLRRRSTIADEMRFFFVSVASVAFSRQKAGNVSDANRKTAQSSRKFAQVRAKKRKRKLVITCHNLSFWARKMRDKRERDETETKQRCEAKQRKSRDRTRKEQGNAAHLFPDYQPLNRTNPTP